MRITLFLLALAAAAAVAKERKIACPEEVPAHTVRVVEAPQGWTGFMPEAFRLRSAAITLGNLEQRAVQLGEHEKLSQGRYKMVYPHLGMRKERKWVICEYDGPVLGYRIPDDTAQCEMVYTPGQHDIRIDITCR